MSPAERALRKSLAMAASDPGNVIRADGTKVGYKGDRSMGGWIADALIAGPLAPILDRADSADEAAVVLDKFEPLIPSLPAGFIGSSLPERVESIAREAIDGREGERRWAERAGITLGVSSTDDPAALADALKAAAIRTSAAEARADRLSAEVEALREVLKPFASMSAMEPPETIPLNEWLPAITGARAVLNDRTALARAAVKAETEDRTNG